MPGRIPVDQTFISLQVDPNAFDDFDDPLPAAVADGDSAPPYNLYIPPRTHGGKRKKSKNRRRHSDTIWTIVSEQENSQHQQHPHFATTTKPSSSGKHKSKSKSLGSSSKDKDKETCKHKEGGKKSKKKHGKDNTPASFLDNPIFETGLQNWTLPRAELWCRDPQCQINVQLWNNYCQSHQTELTQLQVQELLHQQHQYVHQQQRQHQVNQEHLHHQQHQLNQEHLHHQQHQLNQEHLHHQQHQLNQEHLHHQQHQLEQEHVHHRSPPPPPPLPHHQQRRLLAEGPLPPDLPAPATLSRRQRLSTISQIFDDTNGANNGHSSSNQGCSHPFHHQQQQQQQQSEEEEGYYSHQYGNMHINMSIGASMNNLNGHHPHSHHQDSGVGTPSPSTSKNNIIPTAIPRSSGGSSAKTASTAVTSSSSSGGGTKVKSSRHAEDAEGSSGGGSTRDNYGGSTSSSSSSSSSSGEVSSGSTFVTGFDSSESRGSSVPSSLNKPPHPALLDPSNNSKHNSSSNNHHHSNHHRSSKSNGDNNQHTQTVATTAASGFPSVPYLPTGYRKPGICPSCNGLVPPPSSTNHHLIPVDPILSAAGLGGPADATTLGLPHHHHHAASSHQYHHNITSASNVNANKSDNAFWNFSKFQHPLQRDHSFHSVGGFTLNGQYNTQVKKRRMVKFCSSHKIALVVSTFSLMVTIGLIITLILMKKRGMMDTMDKMS